MNAGQTDDTDTLPRSILFVCNLNSVRSPMAHALADRRFRRRVFVDSVGLGVGRLDPFSVAVMAEIGIDIADYEPKPLSAVDVAAFDHVIALTKPAYERVRTLGQQPEQAMTFWDTEDPSVAEGPRRARLAIYRAVRDDLNARIDAFVGGPR